MSMGGLYGSSKYDALKLLPTENVPKTLLLHPGTSIEKVMEQMESTDLDFPLVIKPDQGERGKGIQLLENKEQLSVAITTHPTPFLIQEYIDFPFEAGVFYIRIPDQKEAIVTSIVVKGFLSVVGDGQSTLEQLALQNIRAVLIWPQLKDALRDDPERIPDRGELVLLEAIGNHSRGTAFNDGNHLKCQGIVDEAKRLAEHLPGFYYGRFDLRAPSEQSFITGEDWKIMEVNGVNAEPAHIYQHGASLLKGSKSLYWHWSTACLISRKNKKNHPPVKFKEALRVYRQWRMVKPTKWV